MSPIEQALADLRCFADRNHDRHVEAVKADHHDSLLYAGWRDGIGFAIERIERALRELPVRAEASVVRRTH